MIRKNDNDKHCLLDTNIPRWGLTRPGQGQGLLLCLEIDCVKHGAVKMFFSYISQNTPTPHSRLFCKLVHFFETPQTLL